MAFPSFTFFNLFATMFFVFSFFAISKILTMDWKLNRREIIYFTLVIPFTSVVSVINRDIFEIFSHTVGDLMMVLFAFLYFHKLKAYSIKKTTILSFITVYINITMTYISIVIFYFSFADFGVSPIPNFLPVVTNGISALETLQVLSYFPFFVVPTVLIVKFSGKLRQTINQNSQLQTLLMYISIIIFMSFRFLIEIWSFIGYTDWVASFRVISFVITCVTLLLGFYFYTKIMEAKYEHRQRENDLISLQRYTDELERQQAAIGEFRHDYQNVLISIRSFIKEKDWAGLENYYLSKIEPTSKAITSNDLALEHLSKIKVREIKSILTSKLIMAQNMDICTIFGAHEEIDHIPADSIVIVRMLGIILDNAIEALAELGAGTLWVGCFKEGASIVFIVKNTCSCDISDLHQLKQQGFSTKGEGRGFGLSNLYKLVKDNPNIALETTVEANHFIQKLIITKNEG